VQCSNCAGSSRDGEPKSRLSGKMRVGHGNGEDHAIELSLVENPHLSIILIASFNEE
jgi:hypothetical protein